MVPMTDTLDTQQSPEVHPREIHTAHRPHRLYRAAALVGIIAGIVFITGAVFFTGFILGHQGGHGGHHMRMHNSEGPWRMGPPMGPGMMGPGMMAPPPNAPAPASPPPAPRS